MCCWIDARPNFSIDYVSIGSEIAHKIDPSISAIFQLIDGKIIASGYKIGMDVPFDIVHILWRNNILFLLPLLWCEISGSIQTWSTEKDSINSKFESNWLD